MSLDLPHIIQQVQQFGEATLKRLAMRQKQLPALVQAFSDLGQVDTQSLLERLETTPEGWRGALPTQERLTTQFPPPDPLEEIDVIATDGSQIYPDRHSPVLYYLINIGGIRMPYGDQRRPDTFSRPSLYYNPEDVFDGGHLVSPAIVNGRRDVTEMVELAALAEQPSNALQLALLDNSLLLRLASGDREKITKSAHQLIKEFVGALSRLRHAGAGIAGFIDRPGSTDLLNTVAHLASSEYSTLFTGLIDLDLMAEWLQPYHRSALFRWQMTDFPELSQAGHALHFFYLHTGPAGAIARIEVPQWVAEDPNRVNQVHAGILRDSRSTGGYPYSLIRAHELAVVTYRERDALEQWLFKNLVDHGLTLSPSRKAMAKKWLGGERKHKL
jgi:hypothetical protein